MFHRLFRSLKNAPRVDVQDDDLVSAYGILMPQSKKRDLSLITAAATIGILFTVITGFPSASAILTAFYKDQLQMSNGLLSVVLAIPQLAVVVQIPISVVLRKSRHLKRFAVVSGLLVRVSFIVMAILAFLLSQNQLAVTQTRHLVILIVMLSSLGLWTADLSVNTWLGIVIPYPCRGRYLSHRQLIYTLSSLIFSLLLLVLASFLAKSSLQYMIYFLLAAVLGITDFLLLAKVRDPYTAEAQNGQESLQPDQAATEQVTLSEEAAEISQEVKKKSAALLLPLRDRQYRTFLGFVSVWYFAVAIPQPFFNVHMNGYLGMSLGMQTVINTAVAAVGTMLSARPLGRLSDRYGYRNTLLLSSGIAIFLPLIWTTVTPASIWITFVANLFSGMFFVATDMNVFSMSIFLAPEEQRPSFLVAKTLAQALLGTVPGMLLGGSLMEALAAPLEAAALPFVFGQRLLPFHVLLMASFVLRTVAVLLFARRIRINKGEEAFKTFLAELSLWLRQRLSGFHHRLNVALWFKPRGQNYVALSYGHRFGKLIWRIPLLRKWRKNLLLQRKQRIVKLPERNKAVEQQNKGEDQ